MYIYIHSYTSLYICTSTYAYRQREIALKNSNTIRKHCLLVAERLKCSNLFTNRTKIHAFFVVDFLSPNMST